MVPHTCCLCAKVYSTRSSLTKHLENSHFRSTKFVCTFCPKFYFNKNVLKHHMKNHGEKKFQCNNCDYKTAIELRFKEHKLTHGAKEECPICSRKVTNLQQHLRKSHAPKKACPICQKMIPRYNIGEHLQTHEEKHYCCEQCDEIFGSKEDSRRFLKLSFKITDYCTNMFCSHILKKHYDGNIYECHCGAAYKSKSHLLKHQKIHEGRTKTCEVCQQEFTSIDYFRNHWRMKHQKTHGMLEINKS